VNDVKDVLRGVSEQSVPDDRP